MFSFPQDQGWFLDQRKRLIDPGEKNPQRKDIKSVSEQLTLFTSLDNFAKKLLDIPVTIDNQDKVQSLQKTVDMAYKKFSQPESRETIITQLRNDAFAIQKIMQPTNTPSTVMFKQPSAFDRLTTILRDEKILPAEEATSIASLFKKVWYTLGVWANPS